MANYSLIEKVQRGRAISQKRCKTMQDWAAKVICPKLGAERVLDEERRGGGVHGQMASGFGFLQQEIDTET